VGSTSCFSLIDGLDGKGFDAKMSNEEVAVGVLVCTTPQDYFLTGSSAQEVKIGQQPAHGEGRVSEKWNDESSTSEDIAKL
jgi:hypothetical protein